MVFKKSGIQWFKQIAIQIWNKGDMTNWSNAAQRACCYEIAYESNSFWFFGLLLLGSFWWQLGLLGFLFSLTPFFVVGLFFFILNFILILIAKYATRFPKAMRYIFNYSLVLIICSWLIAYAASRYFGLLDCK